MAYPVSVIGISAASCVLSILGAIVIFGTYCAIPEIRNFTRKLMLCLTVADLLTASGYLMAVVRYSITTFSPTTDQLVCTTQSVITTYSTLVSCFLTVIIAVHIFSTVVYRRTNDSWAFFLIANGIGWVLPGIIVGVAEGYDALGEDRNQTAGTGPWCWVDTTQEYSTMWMWIFVSGKGWELMCYLSTTSLYVLLQFYLYTRHHRERFSTLHTTLRDEDKNFLYVWFVLYVIRLWGTIRMLAFIVKPDISETHLFMEVFLHMQAFGDPAQAFCNCLLFCILDETVRNRLLRPCCHIQCQDQQLLQTAYMDSEDENSTLIESENSERGTENSTGCRNGGNYGSAQSTSAAQRDINASVDDYTLDAAGLESAGLPKRFNTNS